jgi:hypothetical protein
VDSEAQPRRRRDGVGNTESPESVCSFDSQEADEELLTPQDCPEIQKERLKVESRKLKQQVGQPALSPGGAAETSIMRHEVKSRPGNTWPRYELDSALDQGSQARRLRHAEDGVDRPALGVSPKKNRANDGWIWGAASNSVRGDASDWRG